MEIGNQTTTMFAYLYRDHPRTIAVTRVDLSTIVVGLPHPITGKVETQELDWDYRDQRTLVAFDGDVLWQGVPRAAGYLQGLGPYEVPIRRSDMRKKRTFEESQPSSILLGDTNDTILLIQRHVLLVPATTFVFRRYDPHGLGRYTFVEVKREGVNTAVTWRNSSY